MTHQNKILLASLGVPFVTASQIAAKKINYNNSMLALKLVLDIEAKVTPHICNNFLAMSLAKAIKNNIAPVVIFETISEFRMAQGKPTAVLLGLDILDRVESFLK